jgi:putative aldouronate transport system permease protein
MVRERSLKYVIVDIVIYLLLALILLSTALPFAHEIAISFSGRAPVRAKTVGLWPQEFTLDNYAAAMARKQFARALAISCLRVIVAVPATLLVAVLTAYPLAFERFGLPGRRAFLVALILINLLQVGLIPRYLSYKNLGLIDNPAVLILPTLLTTFNTILVINYFRGVPFDLVEAAMIDGASHWQVLSQVMVPMSTPVLATICLFTFVRHWNAWFDGVVYLRNASNWPLQSYLYTVLSTTELSSEYSGYRYSGRWPNVSGDGVGAAMVLFAVLPVLIIYPLLQRYFVSGINLGAVKG